MRGGWVVVALACVADCGRTGLEDGDAGRDAAVAPPDARDADAAQNADASADVGESSDNGDDASLDAPEEEAADPKTQDASDEPLSCGQLGDPCGFGTRCGGCFGPWGCSGNGICIDVGPQ
jgi:hypothetical protein